MLKYFLIKTAKVGVACYLTHVYILPAVIKDEKGGFIPVASGALGMAEYYGLFGASVGLIMKVLGPIGGGN